jgi:hypothetical protein
MAKDNLGDFTKIVPLLRMDRILGRRDISSEQLEDHQALRIFHDLQAFIATRYPHGRNIVFANSFLTLGTTFAVKAGVNGGEIASFVAAEQSKLDGLGR